MKQKLDFYCNGFRWFDNYEKTKEQYQKIENKPNIRQYYGQGVLTFHNITELNTTIQELTLLRDSVIQNVSKHPKIQKEFGTDGSNRNIPYNWEEIFYEDRT